MRRLLAHVLIVPCVIGLCVCIWLIECAGEWIAAQVKE